MRGSPNDGAVHAEPEAGQTITIKQGSLCVDNNFMVEPPPS